MPDPTVSTYAGLPGYLILWVLALAAFGLFGSVGAAPRPLRRARAGAAPLLRRAPHRRRPLPDLLGLRLLRREFLLEPGAGRNPRPAHPLPRRGAVDDGAAGGTRRAGADRHRR